MKVVLVTGSRNFSDESVIYHALNHEYPEIIVHGAAKGADLIAEKWAKEFQITYIGYPAQWTLYGKPAGHKRNVKMLNLLLNMKDRGDIIVVCAFPLKGSVGTYDMIKLAEKESLVVNITI